MTVAIPNSLTAPSVQTNKAGITQQLEQMSTDTETVAFPHPLDPLGARELERCAGIISTHAKSIHPDSVPWFKHITLMEPPKAELVPWLLAARSNSTVPKPLSRRASALISQKLLDETVVTEYIVSLDQEEVEATYVVDRAHHAPLDLDEMVAAEKALLEDPCFRKVIEKLNLPEGSHIIADPWPYGTDTMEVVPRLIAFMCYFRLGSDLDSNHYSLPLPLIPCIDPHTMTFHSVIYTPIFGGESVETVESLWAKGASFPWETLVVNEYKHQLRGSSMIRQDVKPLQVVQPHGASFTVEGYKVTWQKWEFRVGFNYREGLTLHDVRYDGRDIFHRLSISDMTVPYGDPRSPFHRKQAFDLGDVGAGICANQLDLGCDCLGTIHYFSADIINSVGTAQHLKNVVCLHEQDEGLGWKHTNYRTGNASVTRSRVLVIQTIITVANYEYIFAWKLDQAAAVHLETRATGILSTHAIMPGETSPYGNVVNPGVFAPNHQHLFSVRIDPAIGLLGEGNSIVQEDSVTMQFDKTNPQNNNRWGVGYTVQKKLLDKSGWADASPQTNRIFKIINPSRTNPISGRPIGYKLVPVASQLLLAHEDSINNARAEFGNHHIWVTKHQDGELFAGGNYTNQSNGGANGIKSWVSRDDVVSDSDLVLWHTFGLTHNPRVEDFPVMPCEIHTMSLKPVDFFTFSPAIDVPSSTQAFNRSTLAASEVHQSAKADESDRRSLNDVCCQP